MKTIFVQIVSSNEFFYQNLLKKFMMVRLRLARTNVFTKNFVNKNRIPGF